MWFLIISLACFITGFIVFFITDDLDIMEIGLNLMFASLFFAILGGIFIVVAANLAA